MFEDSHILGLRSTVSCAIPTATSQACARGTTGLRQLCCPASRFLTPAWAMVAPSLSAPLKPNVNIHQQQWGGRRRLASALEISIRPFPAVEVPRPLCVWHTSLSSLGLRSDRHFRFGNSFSYVMMLRITFEPEPKRLSL